MLVGILDDDDDPETLVNVNMIDAERALRNIENRKKKPDYNPYDDAEEDEYGMVGSGEEVCRRWEWGSAGVRRDLGVSIIDDERAEGDDLQHLHQ